MHADEVVFAVADGVARVTLNRPGRRNALTIAMADALTECWSKIDADDAVRVAILDAADCGTFCAGMDLKEMAALQAEGGDFLARMKDPFQESMRKARKPIVAALTGHISGAGMLLARGADVRVGLVGTKAAISEVRFGRGTSWTVPLLWMIPQPVLSEMVLTGDPLPIEELWRHGFINHLEADAAAVRARADGMARRIAENAPLSVCAAKATLAAGMDLGCADGLFRGETLHRAVYASADAIEGPTAFAEGRRPVWQGR